MKRISKSVAAILMASAVYLVASPDITVGRAEPAGDPIVVRDILQTTPIEAPVPQNAVTGLVIFPPRPSTGRHIHHGVESGYILSGEVEIVRDGERGQTYRAGETFSTTRDHPHVSQNTTDSEARAIVTWIVDTDKPLTVSLPN